MREEEEKEEEKEQEQHEEEKITLGGAQLWLRRYMFPA